MNPTQENFSRPAASPDANAGGGAVPPAAPEEWGWTRRQRVGLGMLLSLLFVVLLVTYIRRPARLDDHAVVIRGQTVGLPRRVNPNTATREELSRIPQLGEARADRIIEYREAHKGAASDGIVFRVAADLDNVPGIGAKLVEQFEPFLEFPEMPAPVQ